MNLDQVAHPLQKFHVLSRHAGLTELEQLMRRRWIVQYDLKDLGTEEVRDAAGGRAIAIAGSRHRWRGFYGLPRWRCRSSLRRMLLRSGGDVPEIEAMMVIGICRRRRAVEVTVSKVCHCFTSGCRMSVVSREGENQ
jgi:hypothetical protein